MPIRSVVINTTDVERAAAFYAEYLELPVTRNGDGSVCLDSGSCTIHLRSAHPPADASSWVADNHQLGFRHIGFKVTEIDARAERMANAGVKFQYSPLNAGPMRICFFFDPDGTLLEMVQGDVAYTEIQNAAAVRRERAMPLPAKPRFDHVAITVADRDAATRNLGARFDFRPIGRIDPPPDPNAPPDLDGFRMAFLKSEDHTVEIFTLERNVTSWVPQMDHPGFRGMELSRPGQAGTGDPKTARLEVDSNCVPLIAAGP